MLPKFVSRLTKEEYIDLFNFCVDGFEKDDTCENLKIFYSSLAPHKLQRIDELKLGTEEIDGKIYLTCDLMGYINMKQKNRYYLSDVRLYAYEYEFSVNRGGFYVSTIGRAVDDYSYIKIWLYRRFGEEYLNFLKEEYGEKKALTIKRMSLELERQEKENPPKRIRVEPTLWPKHWWKDDVT